MASQKIAVIKDSNNIKLIFNIKKDNRVESILGAIIELEFKNSRTGKVLNRNCIITDSSTAECMYTITSEDTQEVGGYASEMTIKYSNGTVLKVNNPVVLIVEPQAVP